MFPYSRSASAGVSNIVDCGPNRLQLLTLGSLRNDYDYGNKNVKKAIGLDKQNNNFARASRFFVHFSAVVARLQRETA